MCTHPLTNSNLNLEGTNTGLAQDQNSVPTTFFVRVVVGIELKATSTELYSQLNRF